MCAATIQQLPHTVDEGEIAKFHQMADEWWDPNGKFKPLHIMNPYRISYIKAKICDYLNRDANDIAPLKGLKILDIGCGGGLVAEAFARLGANVTGIDASEKTIAIAKTHLNNHSANAGLSVQYHVASLDGLQDHSTVYKEYDIVLALEILEHVADISAFIIKASHLIDKEGLLFTSTLNRTAKSYMLAILGAEYILRWLPIGTHEWKKFIRPSELIQSASAANLRMTGLNGMVYNPFTQKWSFNPHDLGVNYICQFERIS